MTAEQFAEVAAEMDARTGALMERTGSQAYADAGRTLDQWEFERRIDDQIQRSAQAMNDKLDMQIQASVKAPHFEFEPEMDAVTRAEYAARGSRTVDFMNAQAQAIANGAEVGHEPFRGAGASGSWAYGGASGSWDEPMSGYDKFSIGAHAGLSAAGAFPVLGIFADAADFVYTAAELPFGKSSALDLGLAGAGILATPLLASGDVLAAGAKIEARIAEAQVKTSAREGATFGKATTSDYRKTFFDAHPELEGKVVVHHAVEQQTLVRYPGLVSNAEIHSLENLRGIPKEINSEVHLSQIRREWNQFYRMNPAPTQQQFLQKATEIDQKLGSQFLPPR